MTHSNRTHSILVLLGLTTGLSGMFVYEANGQQLMLSANVGKEVFFEGEPIYALFELSNKGPDTIWVGGFEFGPDRLAVSLRGSDGSLVPASRMWIDYALPFGWRGTPIPPGEPKHLMVILQNMVGNPVRPSWTMFPRRISTGTYTLVASFNSAVEGSGIINGAVVSAPPLRIEVRQRTAAEERSFAEVDQLLARGWDHGTRANFFPKLLQVVRRRLAADSSDPFAAFVVTDAVMMGHAWGLGLGPGDRSQLTAARLSIARAQGSRPSGAMAALALSAEAIPPSDLPALLGPSLAGEIAKWHQRVPRRPVFHPGRPND